MKFPWLQRLLELPRRVWLHPRVQGVVSWSQRRSLPGFFSVPIYDVIVFVYQESKSDLVTRANSMAFSFFLALFPGVLALLATIPIIQQVFLPNGPDLITSLEAELGLVVPGTTGTAIFSIVRELTEQSPALFSIGTILAIYFASNGMMSMIRSFDKSYQRTFKRRKLIRKRMVALLLTIQLGLALLFSAFVIIQLNLSLSVLAEEFTMSRPGRFLLSFLSWTVLFLLFYGIITSLYRYGPATIRRTGWVSPGATLATLLSLGSSLGFTFYVDYFGTYNMIYGSIGAVIVLLLWIQLNAFILLVGYELNAAIAVNRDLRAEPQDL